MSRHTSWPGSFARHEPGSPGWSRPSRAGSGTCRGNAPSGLRPAVRLSTTSTAGARRYTTGGAFADERDRHWVGAQERRTGPEVEGHSASRRLRWQAGRWHHWRGHPIPRGRSRGAGKSRSLIRSVIAPVRQTFNRLIEDAVVTLNPASRIGRYLKDKADPRSRPEPLGPDEEVIFLGTAFSYVPRHYPMFLCAVRSGVRLGELLGLQWGDLDFHERFIEVRRSLREGGREELQRTGRFDGWTCLSSSVKYFNDCAWIGRRKLCERAGVRFPSGSSVTRKASRSGNQTSSAAVPPRAPPGGAATYPFPRSETHVRE